MNFGLNSFNSKKIYEKTKQKKKKKKKKKNFDVWILWSSCITWSEGSLRLFVFWGKKHFLWLCQKLQDFVKIAWGILRVKPLAMNIYIYDYYNKFLLVKNLFLRRIYFGTYIIYFYIFQRNMWQSF